MLICTTLYRYSTLAYLPHFCQLENNEIICFASVGRMVGLQEHFGVILLFLSQWAYRRFSLWFTSKNRGNANMVNLTSTSNNINNIQYLPLGTIDEKQPFGLVCVTDVMVYLCI